MPAWELKIRSCRNQYSVHQNQPTCSPFVWLLVSLDTSIPSQWHYTSFFQTSDPDLLVLDRFSPPKFRSLLLSLCSLKMISKFADLPIICRPSIGPFNHHQKHPQCHNPDHFPHPQNPQPCPLSPTNQPLLWLGILLPFCKQIPNAIVWMRLISLNMSACLPVRYDQLSGFFLRYVFASLFFSPMKWRRRRCDTL